MTKQLQRLERTSDLEYQRDAQEHAMAAAAIVTGNYARLVTTPGLWHSLAESEKETPDDPEERLPYWLAQATNCQVAANQAIYHSGRLLDIAREASGGSNNEYFSSNPRGLSRATCYAHWGFYNKVNKLQEKAQTIIGRDHARDPDADLSKLIPPERAFNRSSLKVAKFIEAWFKGVDLDAAVPEASEEDDDENLTDRKRRELPTVGSIKRRAAVLIADTRHLKNDEAKRMTLDYIVHRGKEVRSEVPDSQPGEERVVVRDFDTGWDSTIKGFVEEARYCDDRATGIKALETAAQLISEALRDLLATPVDPTSDVSVDEIACPEFLDNPQAEEDPEFDLTSDLDDDLARAIEGDRS